VPAHSIGNRCGGANSFTRLMAGCASVPLSDHRQNMGIALERTSGTYRTTQGPKT
jgi:hypothetical protein